MRYAIIALLCFSSAAGGSALTMWLLSAARIQIEAETPMTDADIHRICADEFAPDEAAVTQCRANVKLTAIAKAMRDDAVKKYKEANGL